MKKIAKLPTVFPYSFFLFSLTGKLNAKFIEGADKQYSHVNFNSPALHQQHEVSHLNIFHFLMNKRKTDEVEANKLSKTSPVGGTQARKFD